MKQAKIRNTSFNQLEILNEWRKSGLIKDEDEKKMKIPHVIPEKNNIYLM